MEKEQVKEALEKVLVPSVGRSIVKLNLVRGIEIISETVKVKVALTGLDVPVRDWIKSQAEDVLKEFPEVRNVEVDFVGETAQEINRIQNIIAVMSGKGGVGKSLVSGLVAIVLNRKGYEVGILDADITGPSIPKMFGINWRPGGSDTGILPVLSRSGMEVMSINLLLPHEEDAVIWRGPLISKAITQFWEEVIWGNLDYLVVDLPPGTADAPLTVMQLLPLSGVIIVFTPQDLTTMVVKKAVQMANQMKVPILGVVENMSYFTVPNTGEKIEIFGRSKGEEMAEAASAPFLGQIPIDPELARLCDKGEIETYSSDILISLTEALAEATKKIKGS